MALNPHLNQIGRLTTTIRNVTTGEEIDRSPLIDQKTKLAIITCLYAFRRMSFATGMDNKADLKRESRRLGRRDVTEVER